MSGGVWFYDGDVVFCICGSVGRRVGCWARMICMVVYGGAWLQAACGNPVVTWCRCAARADGVVTAPIHGAVTTVTVVYDCVAVVYGGRLG